MVQSERVLAGLEIFLYGPAAPGDSDERPQGDGASFGSEAQVERHLTDALLIRDEAAADQQVAARVGGADPRPGVAAFAFGALPAGVDDPVSGDQHLQRRISPSGSGL